MFQKTGHGDQQEPRPSGHEQEATSSHEGFRGIELEAVADRVRQTLIIVMDLAGSAWFGNDRPGLLDSHPRFSGQWELPSDKVKRRRPRDSVDPDPDPQRVCHRPSQACQDDARSCSEGMGAKLTRDRDEKVCGWRDSKSGVLLGSAESDAGTLYSSFKPPIMALFILSSSQSMPGCIFDFLVVEVSMSARGMLGPGASAPARGVRRN